MVLSQSEARVSTEHGIKVGIASCDTDMTDGGFNHFRFLKGTDSPLAQP